MRYHDASPRGGRGGRRGWSDSDRAGQPSAAGNFSGHASLYTVDFLALRDTVVGSCRSEARNTPSLVAGQAMPFHVADDEKHSTLRFHATGLRTSIFRGFHSPLWRRAAAISAPVKQSRPFPGLFLETLLPAAASSQTGRQCGRAVSRLRRANRHHQIDLTFFLAGATSGQL